MAGAEKTSATIDADQFRHALGAFATGVTIITTSDQGDDVGLTANSFNSVSLNPPMVLWSLSKTSFSLQRFQRASHFAVHVLAEDQEEISTRFAKRGDDKFRGMTVERGEGGLPLLSGCNARFQCRKVYEYEGGDHAIFVGEVLAFDHEAKQPLVFHRGRYAAATHKTAGAAETRDDGDESLSYLVARAHIALRGASLKYAEERGLSLPERYLLGALLDTDQRGLDEVNHIIGYTGLRISEEAVERLRQVGLVRTAEGARAVDALSLTDAGRKCVVEMIALTRARFAEVEIKLGAKAATLKRLLKEVSAVGDAYADVRIRRHIEVMKNMELDGQ